MLEMEEKKILLDQLINSVEDGGHNEKDATLCLYHALMKDTTCGKLYKYRAVNDYSIEDLRSGTLYCAKPNQFNDPFDCKIGITFKSLYEAKYNVELDFVAQIFEQFILVLQGKKEIVECDEDERRVLNRLMDNAELVEFVTTAWDRDTTLEQEIEIINSHAYLVVQMLESVLKDEKIADSLGICADMLPVLIDKLTPEGKWALAEGKDSIYDIAKSNGIYADADEITLSMLLSSKLFPERVDEVDRVASVLEDMEHNLLEKLNNVFRVICLTTDYKNRLMWSHYAESHRGFCIEYDFSESSAEVLNSLPMPIIYSETRPLVPWKAAIANSDTNIMEASYQLVVGMLTKDKAWEYENEWRILTAADSDVKHKMPRISAVYLGVAMEEKNKNLLISICSELGIPVKQMIIDKGEYLLHSIDIV